MIRIFYLGRYKQVMNVTNRCTNFSRKPGTSSARCCWKVKPDDAMKSFRWNLIENVSVFQRHDFYAFSSNSTYETSGRGENGISHIFCTSRPYLEIGAKMMRNFPSEITFLTLQPFILVDIFWWPRLASPSSLSQHTLDRWRN